MNARLTSWIMIINSADSLRMETNKIECRFASHLNQKHFIYYHSEIPNKKKILCQRKQS